MRPQPGQWGEHGMGVAAEAWILCTHRKGVLGSRPPRCCWEQGFTLTSSPLFYVAQPFLGEVVGMVGLGWREEPYLSCGNGNGMEPTGLPQCVWEESTLLWEPFMFCFQEKKGGEGELLLLSTRFPKQETEAMQLRLQPPSPQTKTQPRRASVTKLVAVAQGGPGNMWRLRPGSHGRRASWQRKERRDSRQLCRSELSWEQWGQHPPQLSALASRGAAPAPGSLVGHAGQKTLQEAL